jgi:DNA-binding transcriptional MerR regulator
MTIFSIKEVAEKLSVHQQTLRNWERCGLFDIQRVGINKTRVFSEKDIELCRKIQKYSGKGISLKGIKELLSMNGNNGQEKGS